MEDVTNETSSFTFLMQLSREDSLADLLEGCNDFHVQGEGLEESNHHPMVAQEISESTTMAEEANVPIMELTFATAVVVGKDLQKMSSSRAPEYDEDLTQTSFDTESSFVCEAYPVDSLDVDHAYAVEGQCLDVQRSFIRDPDVCCISETREASQKETCANPTTPRPAMRLETHHQEWSIIDPQESCAYNKQEEDCLPPTSLVFAKCHRHIQTETYYEVPPHKRVYFTPAEDDVLLGRGKGIWGWKGNLRFLRLKKTFQERYQYKGLDKSNQDKRAVIEALFFKIKERGRFLKRDENGWYEVSTRKARDKCSQALREDYTRETYREKRLKYHKQRHRNGRGKSAACPVNTV